MGSGGDLDSAPQDARVPVQSVPTEPLTDPLTVVGAVERRIGLMVLRLLGGVLLVTVVVVLVHPSDPNIDFDPRLVLAGLVASAVLAAGRWLPRRTRRADPSARRADPSSGRRPQVWVASVAISVLASIVTLSMGWLLRYRYGWDANVVTTISGALFADEAPSRFALDYLSRYPNNVPLLALMNLARAAGSVFGLTMFQAYLIFNAVCGGVAVLLTFVLVRLVRGVRAAFVAQGLVVLLLSASPWSAVPYTDLPAVPLVLGAVTLACAALRATRPSAKALLVVGAFGAAGAGYVVKTTPATTAVALAVVGVVVALSLRRRDRVAALLLVAVGLASFGTVAVVGGQLMYEVARLPKAQLDLGRSPPPTWWLANGLITSTHSSGRKYYGSFSTTLVKDSQHLRGQQLQDWSERRLADQVAELGVGIVPFEVKKQAFVWGDGMFFAWGEGYDFQTTRIGDHSATARAVQAFQHPSGAWYVARASLTTGVWAFLLLWIALGLVRAPYRRTTMVLALTVLGIMAFLLLFQARSRYLIAYLPVIVSLAVSVDPRDLLRPARTMGHTSG